MSVTQFVLLLTHYVVTVAHYVASVAHYVVCSDQGAGVTAQASDKTEAYSVVAETDPYKRPANFQKGLSDWQEGLSGL